MKTAERTLAERLRREHGMSVREIARSVGVSRSTASVWLRSIELTPGQRAALEARNPIFNRQIRGASTNKRRGQERRAGYQARGRARFAAASASYLAGCALYWGEGEKARNSLRFTNADPAMIAFFLNFLRREFEVPNESVRIRLHVYPDHEAHLDEIESFWLDMLGLDRSCLNRSAVNRYSRASKRKRVNLLPNGTCRLSVCSTEIVQTIYGSIQEMGGFDRPEWLD